MATAQKIRRQENTGTIKRDFRSRRTTAQDQNIRVIMFPTQTGTERIMNQRRTNKRKAVRRYADAYSRPAQQYSLFYRSVLDFFRHLLRNVGIIYRRRRMCSQIQNVIPAAFKCSDKAFFNSKPP